MNIKVLLKMATAMKKTYLTPEIYGLETEPEQPIAGSGVNSNKDIDYGGVDTEGEFNPSVKGDVFDYGWE